MVALRLAIEAEMCSMLEAKTKNRYNENCVFTGLKIIFSMKRHALCRI